MGNKHTAEWDVVSQERCATSGTASRTPNLINQDQDEENHPAAVLGGTAS